MATTFTGQPNRQTQPQPNKPAFKGVLATYSKNLNHPDEVRTFPKGKLELCHNGDVSIGRATFEPGWRWRESVQPIAGTRSCEESHLGYCLQGAMHVVMDDGKEFDIQSGDAFEVAPGHDASVLGKEACIMVDVKGFKNYAKSS